MSDRVRALAIIDDGPDPAFYAGASSVAGVRVPASGAATWGPGLTSQAAYAAGETARFQIWYRDPVASPCGAGFNLSPGLEVTFH